MSRNTILLGDVSKKGNGLTYACRNKLGHTYFSILVWIRSAKQTFQMSPLSMLWFAFGEAGLDFTKCIF